MRFQIAFLSLVAGLLLSASAFAELSPAVQLAISDQVVLKNSLPVGLTLNGVPIEKTDADLVKLKEMIQGGNSEPLKDPNLAMVIHHGCGPFPNPVAGETELNYPDAWDCMAKELFPEKYRNLKIKPNYDEIVGTRKMKRRK